MPSSVKRSKGLAPSIPYFVNIGPVGFATLKVKKQGQNLLYQLWPKQLIFFLFFVIWVSGNLVSGDPLLFI